MTRPTVRPSATPTRPSLIGAARQFELTDEGLAWKVGGKSGVWPYADIVGGSSVVPAVIDAVAPVSRRYRTRRMASASAILSTSWQTVTLMAPQDRDYRAFITQLHARMQQAGSRAALLGGLKSGLYIAGAVVVALVAISITGLVVRALATGEFGGALVPGRLRRAVRLADRRLHAAQPAAGLYVRSIAAGAAAVIVRAAIKRNEM